jgi:HxlR-like helix-turn-helix/SCP-2 sterol transfer family
MVADGMLTRQRYREVPPRVDYELTERARELMPILAELARWGYAWAWGSPRASEAVDIGAILRLAPGLVRTSASLRGTIELTVEGADERSVYQLTASDGRVVIEESAAEHADARVTGTASAWIKTFSPDGDRSGLQMSGNRKLAGELLDGLALASPSAAGATARDTRAA